MGMGLKWSSLGVAKGRIRDALAGPFPLLLRTSQCSGYPFPPLSGFWEFHLKPRGEAPGHSRKNTGKEKDVEKTKAERALWGASFHPAWGLWRPKKAGRGDSAGTEGYMDSHSVFISCFGLSWVSPSASVSPSGRRMNGVLS